MHYRLRPFGIRSGEIRGHYVYDDQGHMLTIIFDMGDGWTAGTIVRRTVDEAIENGLELDQRILDHQSENLDGHLPSGATEGDD